MLIVSIFFVLAIFSFVSCKGASTPDTEIIPNTDTGIVPDEENQTPSLENKEMGFNVVLPGKNISRAVYYTEDDASYYTVVLKKEETVICSKNGNPGETLKFTVTEEGDYNFSVSAYDNKDSLIAEGVASKKITVTDGYVLVKVTLNPKLKELDVDVKIEWNNNITSVGDIVGDMNGDGMILSEIDLGKYKTDSFTYSNAMCAWGGGNGICNFKIRKVAGTWEGDYGSECVKAGSLPAGVTLVGDGNIVLSGLVDGKSYHFELVTLAPRITISLIED